MLATSNFFYNHGLSRNCRKANKLFHCVLISDQAYEIKDVVIQLIVMSFLMDIGNSDEIINSILEQQFTFKYGLNILFPETRATERAGTHASKLMCAFYCRCEIIVFCFAIIYL